MYTVRVVMNTSFTTELWTAVMQGYRVVIVQGSTKMESGSLVAAVCGDPRPSFKRKRSSRNECGEWVRDKNICAQRKHLKKKRQRQKKNKCI